MRKPSPLKYVLSFKNIKQILVNWQAILELDSSKSKSPSICMSKGPSDCLVYLGNIDCFVKENYKY